MSACFDESDVEGYTSNRFGSSMSVHLEDAVTATNAWRSDEFDDTMELGIRVRPRSRIDDNAGFFTQSQGVILHGPSAARNRIQYRLIFASILVSKYLYNFPGMGMGYSMLSV